MSNKIDLTVILDINFFFINEYYRLCCKKCLKSDYHLRIYPSDPNTLHIICAYCGQDVKLKKLEENK